MKNTFALFILLCTNSATATENPLLRIAKTTQPDSDKLFKNRENTTPFPFGSCEELLRMQMVPGDALEGYEEVVAFYKKNYEKAIFVNEKFCIHLKKDNNHRYVYSFNVRCAECAEFYRHSFP